MAWSEAPPAWERIQDIASAEIDRSANGFRITTRRDVDDLIVSVREFGLLVPPLVLSGPAGWVVVSGFRRVEACHRLGWQELPARVLAAHVTPYACACLAVSENALSRSLNLIEMSRGLALMERLHAGGEVPPSDLTAVGLPANPAHAARLRRLCCLPDPLQEGLLEESIPFPVALDLGHMETAGALAFTRWFRQLRPSLNKQREIIALVREIAAREDRPLPEVMADPEIDRILKETEGDNNQKTGRLRGWLRRRRFPQIVQAEENFRTLCARLGLSGPVRLTPPKDFEGNGFTLSMDFRGVEDLRQLQGILENLLSHPERDLLIGGKRHRYRTAVEPRRPGKGNGT